MNESIQLINFLDLSLDEKKMILSWRNHPSIKKWMFHADDISLKDHLNFINSLKNTKDKLYFLVKKEGQYIGVIDFTNITMDSCRFGLYAKVGLKGYGNLLLSTVVEYAFEVLSLSKLVAEVFEINEKAIKLYTAFNFQRKETIILNNKELICMELKNENR